MEVKYLQQSYRWSDETFNHLKNVYVWYLKIARCVELDNINALCDVCICMTLQG